jgi:homoserine O-acetyltransferase
MKRAVSVVGTPRQTSYDILLWNAQLDAIVNLADNDYDSVVRLVASLDNLTAFTPAYVAENTPASGFEDYLKQAVDSIRRRGLADRVPQLRAMIRHDISAGFNGSMKDAAAHIEAKLLVVVSPEDHMVNPIPSREFAALAGSEILELPGICGHVAGACAQEKMTVEVLKFLQAR